MSKVVSRGQALEVSGRFATQIDWNQIDGQKLQDEVISLSPEEFGRRFTAFLKAETRSSFGGLKVACATFDPAKFINKGWAFWKGPKDGNGLKGEEERDKASLALTEVDFEKTDLLTCLKQGESSINGEKKFIRLRKLGRPVYGATQFMGLWQDYQQNRAQSMLENLYQQKGVTYVDFFGDILRSPVGYRSVLCLYRIDDGLWCWHCYWLDSDWGGRNFAAVAQQVSS